MPSGNAVNTTQTSARGELTSAVERGSLEAVKDLLKRSADIEDVDKHGNTALMSAVLGEPEIVRLLVERGADPHRENDEGFHAWDLLKEDIDVNWQWPMPFSAIQIEKILSEASKIRSEFVERQAKEAASEALSNKREFLKSLTHKITIKP